MLSLVDFRLSSSNKLFLAIRQVMLFCRAKFLTDNQGDAMPLPLLWQKVMKPFLSCFVTF